jgi:hypothetical protein
VKALYRQEAAAVLASILAALGNSVTTHSGRPASDLRRAIGDLLADAELLIEAGEVADPLAQAFDLARDAGATVDTLDRVRKTTEAIPTTSLVAASIKNAAIRLSPGRPRYGARSTRAPPTFWSAKPTRALRSNSCPNGNVRSGFPTPALPSR